MKKIKRSILIPSALFIYVTGMAIYFIPRNTEIGGLEKYIMIGASYVIIALLFFVLRRRDKLAAEREEDMKKISKDK